MKIKLLFLSFTLLLFNTQHGFAEETPSAESSSAVESAESSGGIFDELGFGIGLSFTLDTGNNRRIKAAELVNGTVRVTDEDDGIPRLVFEMHNFFWDHGTWGHGPFVAVQAGEDEIINAVAAGWMAGLKYRGDDSEGRSFNIGVGLAADPNVQILGNGITEDQPLPEGETEVRFREETQYGLMFLFSTSW